MAGGKGSDSLSSEPDCLIILVFILWDLCPIFSVDSKFRQKGSSYILNSPNPSWCYLDNLKESDPTNGIPICSLDSCPFLSWDCDAIVPHWSLFRTRYLVTGCLLHTISRRMDLEAWKFSLQNLHSSVLTSVDHLCLCFLQHHSRQMHN